MIDKIFNKLKNEYDTYISDIEDFFVLPEYIQDKKLKNPYFDYIKVWDRLDSEQKLYLLQGYDNVKYEELWSKLTTVEKYSVIQYVNKFDWRKYTPQPSDDELNLLLGRSDFDVEEFFDRLSELQKLRVCTKRDFKYQSFWNKLTYGMKNEIVKHNIIFDPEPYIDELKFKDCKLEDEIQPASLLDEYCERKITNPIHYENIWNHLDKFQKMKIAIRNELYIVNDKEEIFQLFKSYPNQMIDFIKYRIIPQPDLFNKGVVEINFNNLQTNIKDLAIDIFKTFSLIHYEDMEIIIDEMKQGNIIVITEKHKNLLPCCIVKVKEVVGTNCTVQKIKPGYYFCETIPRKFIPIKDYSYILRESKLERLLNNSDD